MALSAFDDKDQEPKSQELDEVLLDAAELWKGLISGVKSEWNPLAQDWVFSGKKWGWALRLKHKKRAVLYMTPSSGLFHVGFALGEKAVNAARAGDLPGPLRELIETSQKFAEGRAIRFEIRAPADLENAMTIARIKMAN